MRTFFSRFLPALAVCLAAQLAPTPAAAAVPAPDRLVVASAPSTAPHPAVHPVRDTVARRALAYGGTLASVAVAAVGLRLTHQVLEAATRPRPRDPRVQRRARRSPPAPSPAPARHTAWRLRMRLPLRVG